MEQDKFLSKLIEERRKELDRVRSTEVVNVMLNRESLWAQIAANDCTKNVQEEESWLPSCERS